MAGKGILPSIINMVLKSRYPLPCAELESSEDDEIERDSIEALGDDQEGEQSPPPPLCAEPESSGDDHTESDSFEAGRWSGRGAIGVPAPSTARRHDGGISGAKRNPVSTSTDVRRRG